MKSRLIVWTADPVAHLITNQLMYTYIGWIHRMDVKREEGGHTLNSSLVMCEVIVLHQSKIKPKCFVKTKATS